jgi:hypothetical protein
MGMSKALVLAGIVAANEWGIQADVHIRFVPYQPSYRFDIVFESPADDPSQVEVETETIVPQHWTNGVEQFWIGYGPKSNVLLVRIPDGSRSLL